MKELLSQLLASQTLTTEQAYQALLSIGQGEVNPSQTAAFLTAYAMKGLTVEEVNGFRQAMLELCVSVDFTEFDPMDVCGTGGDGKNTFNISTTSAFVIAGAGQTVAKHGNHGVSSSVGSSTVIEKLGYEFTNDYDRLRRQLEKAGICYLHAPLFHPAMKHVGNVRRELGFKTFFNLLGPLMNPALVKRQLSGVYSPEVGELYAGVLRSAGVRFAVVHAYDGYDEVSLTGNFLLIKDKETHQYSPEDIGLVQLKAEELAGGNNLQESADILVQILDNRGTKAQTQVVIANAAVALHTAQEISMEEAMERAKESLESGRAYQSLKTLLQS
ncbi:anthranilate phosphoribosyltransferase [Siphonobacter sp. SORGH_AS_0500]|uniref:anthranilate phosphoribosyltransferase n=1 Tax=Siphonobacter sp. SORGH_AS_0500 TaxID=1864824 RepID=UPI00286784A2|nr:anthranilate phosphoribosyltransferase [Siphonobacter sp. SORGH_AS_0500]MDR6193077.1 anthranilate phosphoribosyltransferase [Siphonobacter sp. SORGH_AS_0500]